MTKRLKCGDLVQGCDRVIEGQTEDEVMAQAARHAEKDHGMEVTPELAAQVQGAIREV